MKGIIFTFVFSILSVLGIASQFDLLKRIDTRATIVNNYEVRALQLSKENRGLKVELGELKYQLKEIEAKNNFLKINKKKGGRKIASENAPSIVEKGGKDYVQYEIYKWSPDKLLAIGDKEFQYNNFEKSAQYLHELIRRFPAHQKVNDRVLFEAGIAAYESKKYYSWADEHLSNIVKNHKKSKFHRGAKLWLALSKLKQGDEQAFYNTVEEFRLKYRNTQEWKILSKHYEEFTTRYKK